MQLTINIKENAYDKIIYFLEHFKDDIEILEKKEDNFTKKKIVLSKELDEKIKSLQVINQKNSNETATFIKQINRVVGENYKNYKLNYFRDEYFKEKGLL